jgi:hypothetical protein
MCTDSPPYSIPKTLSSRQKRLIPSFYLDRARVGKHIVGHPFTYVPSATSSHGRSQTMPNIPHSQPHSLPLEPVRKTQSSPVDGPSGPDAFPPPDTSSLPPGDTDLENGSQVSMTKHHWWQRKRTARREHSPVTMAAHKKSPLALFKDIMFSSWANLLLVFIPVGIALHFVPNVNPTVIFVMNFLAIIPLAGVTSQFPPPSLSAISWQRVLN